MIPNAHLVWINALITILIVEEHPVGRDIKLLPVCDRYVECCGEVYRNISLLYLYRRLSLKIVVFVISMLCDLLISYSLGTVYEGCECSGCSNMLPICTSTMYRVIYNLSSALCLIIVTVGTVCCVLHCCFTYIHSQQLSKRLHELQSIFYCRQMFSLCFCCDVLSWPTSGISQGIPHRNYTN